MARRASAINQLRNQKHGTVIVDVGDALLANPMRPTPGDLNKAESIMRGQGVLGLDAMAIGEAEVAVGIDRLRRLARHTSQTLLCANATYRGRAAFAPRKVVETGGVKVGLFALLELPKTDVKRREVLRRARIRTTDPIVAARAQVKALRKEGAEIIVLLGHVGTARVKEIGSQVPGIHLILAAHSGHMYSLPMRAGTTYYVEPGRLGQMLGHVQLRLGPGWSPDKELTDDSSRHVLHSQAREELAKLAKHRDRRPLDDKDPRLVRARALASRLKQVKAPQGQHLIVARLVSLDDSFPFDPALKGMIDADRASWAIGRRPPGMRRMRRVPPVKEAIKIEQ